MQRTPPLQPWITSLTDKTIVNLRESPRLAKRVLLGCSFCTSLQLAHWALM